MPNEDRLYQAIEALREDVQEIKITLAVVQNTQNRQQREIDAIGKQVEKLVQVAGGDKVKIGLFMLVLTTTITGVIYGAIRYLGPK
jgi:hypothetical protein